MPLPKATAPASERETRCNVVSRTWAGDLVDADNNLHLTPASAAFWHRGLRYEAGRYVTERHGRIPPVPVTSSVWNAMQRACALYNAAA